MGENTEVVNQTTQTNDDSTSKGEAVAEPTKLTFDELLKDPEYQAEFDRKVAKSTEKAKAKWQKEAEKERSEAEALAKMSQEEKYEHEISKLKEELKQKDDVISSRDLKDEALNIMTQEGINPSLIKLVNFTGANAETVKAQIDTIKEIFGKAVEDSVNEKLKQPRPKQVMSQSVSSNKAYLDDKYKNNPFYKK